MSQERQGSQDQQQAAEMNQGFNQASAAAMYRAMQQSSAENAANQHMAAMLQSDLGGIDQQQQHQQQQQQQQQQQHNISFSNELKRLQQLTHYGNQVGAPNNALLMSGAQRSTDPSAALLQSMLDQKVQHPRFDNPLQQFDSMQVGNQNPMLQPALFNDARLFMMQQNQLNPNLAGIAGVGMVPPHMAQAAQLPGEAPLPSPHSLFHRDGSRRMRGGVIEPFPEKLHRLLLEVEAAGRSDVISFVASGRAFAIHKPDKFFKEIVPLYFRQSRLSSFKRQLNLYGFELINTGPARGGYYHELFVKDRPELCRRMRRVAVKVATGGDRERKETSVKDESKETESLNPQSGGVVPGI
jgi:hypothetical protein